MYSIQEYISIYLEYRLVISYAELEKMKNLKYNTKRLQLSVRCGNNYTSTYCAIRVIFTTLTYLCVNTDKLTNLFHTYFLFTNKTKNTEHILQTTLFTVLGTFIFIKNIIRNTYYTSGNNMCAISKKQPKKEFMRM